MKTKKMFLIFIILIFFVQFIISKGNGGNTGDGGNQPSDKSNTTIQTSPNSRNSSMKDDIIDSRKKDTDKGQTNKNYKEEKLSAIKKDFINRLDSGKNILVEIQNICIKLTKLIKTKQNITDIENSLIELKVKITQFIKDNDNFIGNLAPEDTKLIKKQLNNIEDSKNRIGNLLDNFENLKSMDKEKLLKINKDFQNEANIMERQYRAIEWIIFEE
ncbi:MAG: hypothetical protein A2086_05775 [Spirochaetes bacterium GWD1_27_9]|nr:MAG: hypothetical protein A2Z98_06000 [Spirochaetes bacterium GWB1_27_13]OHD20272.1 MAG: hypothetical protein A2Y34_15090 [Spirochaetes bacterium GWC1_27_15]OHD35286.1 MAG: hypothetical protein A2086_05775 [Spirochaetes bacterium GWD1_27_9]